MNCRTWVWQNSEARAIWAASLIVFSSFSASAMAQCQRGGSQSPGNSTTSLANAATPYSQTTLGNGYNQNALGPIGYNQFGQLAAMQQYNRQMMLNRSMEVQAYGNMVRNQVALAQEMRKASDKANAAKRKAAQQDREEAIAARQEREAARKRPYESDRATRLASIQ